jgi:hypothetical protein
MLIKHGHHIEHTEKGIVCSVCRVPMPTNPCIYDQAKICKVHAGHMRSRFRSGCTRCNEPPIRNPMDLDELKEVRCKNCNAIAKEDRSMYDEYFCSLECFEAYTPKRSGN